MLENPSLSKGFSRRRTYRFENCCAGNIDVGNVAKLLFRHLDQTLQIRPYRNITFSKDDIARLCNKLGRFGSESQISDNNSSPQLLGGEFDEGEAYTCITT